MNYPSPIIMASCAPKGGPGKTTTACSLAAAGVDQGLRVALLDLDPTARGASRWYQAAKRYGTAYRAIEFAKHRGEVFEATMDALIRRSAAELVLLDCPPAADKTTRTAAFFASVVLVPARPSALDLAPLEDLFAALEATNATRASASRSPVPVLVYLNDVHRDSPLNFKAQEYLEDLVAKARPALPVRIAKTRLSHRDTFVSAIASGESITTAAHPSGALLSPWGAAEVHALYEEAMEAAKGWRVAA